MIDNSTIARINASCDRGYDYLDRSPIFHIPHHCACDNHMTSHDRAQGYRVCSKCRWREANKLLHRKKRGFNGTVYKTKYTTKIPGKDEQP